MQCGLISVSPAENPRKFFFLSGKGLSQNGLNVLENPIYSGTDLSCCHCES